MILSAELERVASGSLASLADSHGPVGTCMAGEKAHGMLTATHRRRVPPC